MQPKCRPKNVVLVTYYLLRYSRGHRDRVRYGNRGQITERNISYLLRKR